MVKEVEERETAAHPTDDEVAVLRAIVEGTARAHGRRSSSSPSSGTSPRRSACATPSSPSSPAVNARAHPGLLVPRPHRRQRRVGPGRHALRGRGAGQPVPLPHRCQGPIPRRQAAGGDGASRATSACRCSTPRAPTSATSPCSTSGRCPPSRAGCSPSASSRPARRRSWNGCSFETTAAARARSGTATSTRKPPSATSRKISNRASSPPTGPHSAILGLKPEEVVGTVGMSLRAGHARRAAPRPRSLRVRRPGHGHRAASSWSSAARTTAGPSGCSGGPGPNRTAKYTRTVIVDITDRVLMEQEKARLQQQNLYLQEEIKSVHNFEEIIGQSPALTAVLDNVRRVAADRRHRPHHGRDGHRQGADRPGDPLQQPAEGQAAHQDQLRRPARRAGRERAVRPREGRLHRGHRPARRPLRAGRRRHDLPRRDRRAARRRPGQAAPRPAGARVRPRRRHRPDQGRRPRPGGHQPRPAQGRPRQDVSRGPLLPPQRLPHAPAAAARAQGRHPAAGPLPGQQVRRADRQADRRASARRRCGACSPTPGRATSASWRTSSSAASSSPPAPRSKSAPS